MSRSRNSRKGTAHQHSHRRKSCPMCKRNRRARPTRAEKAAESFASKAKLVD